MHCTQVQFWAALFHYTSEPTVIISKTYWFKMTEPLQPLYQLTDKQVKYNHSANTDES